MVKGKFSGVNRIRRKLADGSVAVYYYHRATKRRLAGEPGSAEFARSWADAEAATADRTSGTFSAIIRAYLTSAEFSRLARSTQREYTRQAREIEGEFGTMPAGALEDPRVRQVFLAWRDKIAPDHPRAADHRLQIVSAILSWAKERGHVFHNHIAGFRRVYKVDRSDIIWLPEHIEAFNRVASVEMRRALLLALHTGQRQGDILRLTWGQYRDGCISLRQGKTGARVTIPCTPALRTMLDDMPRRGAVILTTASGRPFTSRNFGARWATAMKAAGLDSAGLHFHDLRGTSVTMLAEAGCTVPEIAAITGHSIRSAQSILETYLARTGHLAQAAIARFVAHSRNAP